MKKMFLAGFALLIAINIYSQEVADTSKWKFGGMGTFAFSQLSLYQWSAGGEASYSGSAMLNLHANYKDENTSWINTLDLGYGLIKQGDLTKKSNDRIEFTSQYGKKASKQWFYSAMLNFKTQFTDGYDYKTDPDKAISTLLSPAYVLGSAGMDYKPNDKFQLFISPATGKLTFIADEEISLLGNYGIEAGEKFRAEVGGYVKIAYATPLMENVDFSTKIDMFSNYMNNPQNMDVNWEVLLAMKINEYLSATVNLLMIYDDDINVPREDGTIGPGIQIKEVFGLGLSYKF
ncbi:MAG: DUF3078 domain-containing protein [Bacteroidales bacterium]|nr:DUF3078 domain-containing protein [Bacteroidales bacterium]MCF8390338.1 DUF3078 domain-containing protein [Bacteroidales bacterium]